MNKYIIDLLNKNGSVIIPGFGCLTTSDNQLVFNEFVQFNDGKLINHVHQETGMDIQDIENQISKWYREVLAEINIGNDFIIHGLGKFFKSTIDTIDFSASLDLDVSETNKSKAVSIPKDENEQNIMVSPIAIEDKIDELETQTNEIFEKNSFEENAKEKTVKKSLDDMLLSSEMETVNLLTDEEGKTNIDPFIASTKNQVDITVPEKNEEEVVHAIEVSAKEDKASLPEEKQALVEAVSKSSEIGKDDKRKKRGIFFYFNLLLLLLILGIAVYSYLYFDEVSKFLGVNKTTAPIEIPAQPVAPLDHDVTAELDDSPAIEQGQVEEQIEVAAPKNTAPVQENIDNLPAVSSNGKYHIVVGTFSVQTNADRLVQKIKDAGYDGKILLSSASGYTVAFHSYPSKEEAQDNIEKAKSITSTSAYVLKK